ncbi:uncharacterized protein LOC110386811 isoform X1 [Bombyx mori]|uniref:C2H2-type domain-containing protein n=1 Tax=Bombyx mori TaxID=7091 RepID=A0A8R2DP14_BOMMO|nr:uncharacterized protein LOC110386811 isoform X1 [Bombyx mori]
MFSDEVVVKQENLSADEIISVHEVCLGEKYDKKAPSARHESILSSSEKYDMDVSRSFFRDGFFNEDQDQFAWTEEDGNIVSLVSEPGFGTTGQTSFGRDLDMGLHAQTKEAQSSSSMFEARKMSTSLDRSFGGSQLVSSTTTGNPVLDQPKKNQGARKVDKSDPRSKVHYMKYVKRLGKTVKLWECGICGREFQHQYTLMRHLPTHTDERNFHCVTCGKSFRQLSTLSQHRAIHSSERPYACEVCNKTFNRVSTLISHCKTHSSEKPYRCHLCPKGFHQKGNLRNHLFTHTNERPYRCNICFKGFNQQSNLVCHKNKAHPDENSSTSNQVQIAAQGTSISQTGSDSNRPPSAPCEVSSTMGHLMPPPTNEFDWNIKNDWQNRVSNQSNPEEWGSMINGVVVDAIETYHMKVAKATNQTPFALLKPDTGIPVLVKVVNVSLPGGKQMLVPATAEDLRAGGKIVVQKEGEDAVTQDVDRAVQIKVPVVAIVVPKMQPSGRLHISVEEPHHVYHTTLNSDVITVNISDSCTVKDEEEKKESTRSLPLPPKNEVLKPGPSGSRISCAMPSPTPSPPLDLISMDLFEPIECIPLGPQITAVDDIDHVPSDDSDIFIVEFEESIPLSDSD